MNSNSNSLKKNQLKLSSLSSSSSSSSTTTTATPSSARSLSATTPRGAPTATNSRNGAVAPSPRHSVGTSSSSSAVRQQMHKKSSSSSSSTSSSGTSSSSPIIIVPSSPKSSATSMLKKNNHTFTQQSYLMSPTGNNNNISKLSTTNKSSTATPLKSSTSTSTSTTQKSHQQQGAHQNGTVMMEVHPTMKRPTRTLVSSSSSSSSTTTTATTTTNGAHATNGRPPSSSSSSSSTLQSPAMNATLVNHTKNKTSTASSSILQTPRSQPMKSNNNNNHTNNNNGSMMMVQATMMMMNMQSPNGNNLSNNPNSKTKNHQNGHGGGDDDVATPDFPGKSTGDLLTTIKDYLPRGEITCTCTVGNNYIWTGGTFGQIGIYSNNHTYQNIETKAIWKANDTFSVLTTISVGNEKDVHTIDQRVWSGFASGKVAVWNFETMKKEHEISAHKESVTGIMQAGDRVWTCSMDGTIRIWDSQTLQPLNKHEDHNSAVRSMALIPSLKEVWTCGGDGLIIIRDAVTGEAKSGIEVGNNDVATLHLTVVSNGNIWSSHGDGKIRVWDSEQKVCLKELQAHEAEPTSLISTSKQVWSSGSDKLIRIFDSETMRELKKIRATTVHVQSMLSLTKERVFAVCSDKRIRVWKCEGDQLVHRLPKPASTVKRQLDSSMKRSASKAPDSMSQSMDQSLMRSLDLSSGFDLLNEVATPPEKSAMETVTSELPTHRQVSRLQNNMVPSPMVSPILTRQQTKQRTNMTAQVPKKEQKHNRALLSPEFSVPLTQLHESDEYESTDSDDDDDEDDVHAVIKEAYENEIVILRQQLQEVTSRIGRYRTKLRHRRAKVQEKETENQGLSMKYNVMQEELYSARAEVADVQQQVSDRDSIIEQLHNERKQIMVRLLSINAMITSDSTIKDYTTVPQVNTDVFKEKEVSIRAIEQIMLQIEMDLQLTKFNVIQDCISPGIKPSASALDEVIKENRSLKEKLEELQPHIDMCNQDMQLLMKEISRLQKQNRDLNLQISVQQEQLIRASPMSSPSHLSNTSSPLINNQDLQNLLALTEQSMLSVLEEVNDLKDSIEKEHQSSLSTSSLDDSVNQSGATVDESNNIVVAASTAEDFGGKQVTELTKDDASSCDTDDQLFISQWIDDIVNNVQRMHERDSNVSE